MIAANDPDLIVAGFGIGALVIAAFWRFISWVRDLPATPDPWDAEVGLKLEEAQEVCAHCSTPQPSNAWFCEHCGRAVGPYNNLMPYLQVFSEGEVLRNCGDRHLRNRWLVKIGYFMIGLTFGLPLILSPSGFKILPTMLLVIYWSSLLRK